MKPGFFARLFVFVSLIFATVFAQAATTHTVNVGNDFFADPLNGNSSSITITAGDTIHWAFQAGTHTTTSGTCSGVCTPDGKWDSGNKNPGQTFDQAFPSAGTFPYFCKIHGSFMTGTVIVNAAPATHGITLIHTAFVDSAAGNGATNINPGETVQW